MYFGHSHYFPRELPQLLSMSHSIFSSFVINTQSPVNTAIIHMGLGPPPKAWTIHSSDTSSMKVVDLPSSALNCQ